MPTNESPTDQKSEDHKKEKSEEKVLRIKLPNNIGVPLSILLTGLMISGAIMYTGSGSVLGKKSTGTTKTTTTTTQGTDTTTGTTDTTTATVNGLQDNDHIRGNSDAKLLLIEYSDPDCPYCAQFHDTALQAVNDYDGQVAWVYRHFPIDQLHPNASTKANSMECVASLGGEDAFWNYVDMLYADQSMQPSTLAATAASKLGIDQTDMQNCMDQDTFGDYIQNDYNTGVSAGVQGTPSNFLYLQADGQTISIPGAVPYATLKTSIDKLLAS